MRTRMILDLPAAEAHVADAQQGCTQRQIPPSILALCQRRRAPLFTGPARS